MPRTLAAAGALLVALVAPSAAAAAPTLTKPLKPCYATAGTAAEPQVEAMMITAAGFTANAHVNLTIDGEPVPGGDNLQTDSEGRLGAFSPVEVPAPFIRRGSRRFTIKLTEVENPANELTAGARTTALSVSVSPRSAPPSSRVRFSGRGFTRNRPVYAHYLHHRRNPFKASEARGTLMRTVKLERPRGDCGRFRVRRPQIPVREPRLGFWLIQFDQSRRYAETPGTAFHQLLIRVSQQP